MSEDHARRLLVFLVLATFLVALVPVLGGFVLVLAVALLLLATGPVVAGSSSSPGPRWSRSRTTSRGRIS